MAPKNTGRDGQAGRHGSGSQRRQQPSGKPLKPQAGNPKLASFFQRAVSARLTGP